QQAQYSNLFKESPISLVITDLDGDIIEINNSFEKLLGYSKSDILGRNLSYFSEKEDMLKNIELKEKLLAGSDTFLEMENKYIAKNGKIIHTLLKINVQKDEDNKPAKMLAQIIDISAFIKAEASIKASERSYKELFNSSFELLYILDENNLFIDVSNSVIKEYAYTRKEILGKGPDFLAEQTKMDFNAAVNKVNAAWKGKDQDIFWWSKRKDGSSFPKKLHVKKGVYFGKSVLICSGKNIQNDFEYEQQLLKNEKKYKELINRTIFGTLIFKDEKVVFANQTTINILKYNDIEDLLGVHREKLFALDTDDRLLRRAEYILEGKELPLKEFEMIDAYGESVFVESKPTLIEFEGEQCVFSSFVEITDRKRVEVAEQKFMLQKSANKTLQVQLEQNRQIQRRLQNSQSYSEGVIESSLDMIFTTDIKGKINKLNSSAKKQLQLEKEDFIKKPFEILLSDKKKGIKILEQLNRTNSFSGEVNLKRKDASVFPAFLSISHLFNIDGTFMGIMGISRDISELISKENEIKKQASKLNAIIESSSHYIFTVNRNFRITSFNDLFRKDIIEKNGIEIELFDSFFDVLRENKEDATSFWKEKFSDSFKGKSQKFEVKSNSIEQEPFYREIYLNPVLSENGEIEEISGIGHDTTQKKLNELELTNSLNEKEILLKEVHHRVKNNMQVISSILNLQSSYVTDQRVLDALRESQNRIRAMASIHERLYRTKNLSDIKFSSYIKDLAESLVNTYELSNTSVKLVFSLDEVFLSLNTAIPCGLILNELISNSLKYAFKDRNEGVIDIKLIREREKISLSLSDDGIGIPDNVNVENTDTLGLQLVYTLVEQIEGELKVERLNGTTFTFAFNVNMGA
ncbi:MAG: PAS domain S-box protein, partial [Flavobacteriales bacterium]|nr:PAS domain S-box protein [Flavobacteriales bacterium]